MTDDKSPDSAPSTVTTLQPLGLLCGGQGTPLGSTWVDLTASSHVLYGLNGAGKTNILEALSNALAGNLGSGKLLARLPLDPSAPMLRVTADAISRMLIGTENFAADHAHEVFVKTQRDGAMLAEFRRRTEWIDVEVEGSKFDELDWESFLDEAVRSDLWLFTPTGQGSPRWAASPVVLVEPGSPWSGHLTELALIGPSDDGPIMAELGLDALWYNAPPGAPAGIVVTFIELDVVADPVQPWWPFGQVVEDVACDASQATRQHLSSHPAGWSGARVSPLSRDADLEARTSDIQRRANAILGSLLADAPVLHLSLGDDRAWFMGRSCEWTATRFEGDSRMGLPRLSSAERRWSEIAIKLALADEVNAAWDRIIARQDAGFYDEDAPAPFPDSPDYRGELERCSTTWLLLDEPERGLHRTAETHMARGLAARTEQGARMAVATHSPELLDSGIAETTYVRRRSADRDGAVVPMSDFADLREDLGLNPSDMLRRTRGIVLVEGEHDIEILRGAFGADFDRLGVVILTTRGGSRMKTVVDSRFLYEFTDAILFPMLDDMALNPVRDAWARACTEARIQPASSVIGRLTSELRGLPGKGHEFLGEFLGASIKNGTFDRVEPLGIPQSDVLQCLPIGAFAREATSWAAAWDGLREERRASGAKAEPTETDFKAYLRRKFGADLTAENIRHVAETSQPHPDLKALVAVIASRLSS